MLKRISSTISGICIEDNIDNSQPLPAKKEGKDQIVISASVGINAVNSAKDVITIQDALNRVSPAEGGASPALKVDGVCGPKTKNAIQKFQLEQFGWSGADGKINPGGQTITRINDLLGFVKPDDTTDQIFQAAMTGGLMLAKRWIGAAKVNLEIALNHVDQPKAPLTGFTQFGRDERMRLANRYFRIDDFPAAERQPTLRRVWHTYSLVQQVFERPGGLWGEKAFEIDSMGLYHKRRPNSKAYAYRGGFLYGGGGFERSDGKRRTDSIHIVRENIIHFADMRNAAFILVHELAHFCGDPPQNWDIVDFGAYGEPETPAVARLTIQQRVRHADSYSGFARAAGS